MRNVISLACAAAVVVLSIGCTNSPVGPKQPGPPALPDASSMSMPKFIDNPGGAAAKGLAKSSAVQSTDAATFAYLTVSYWTVGVALALTPPATLFNYARSTTPVTLDDNSGWQWTISGDGYTAVLVGRVEDDSARWSMSVSGNGLDNFTWFTGTSTMTGNAGYWIFNDSTTDPSIRFSYEGAAAGSSATVSVVKPGDVNYGAFFKWSSAGDDKSFEAQGIDEDNGNNPVHVLISWNEAIGSGSIEDLLGGAKVCWDTKANGYQDIACQ